MHPHCAQQHNYAYHIYWKFTRAPELKTPFYKGQTCWFPMMFVIQGFHCIAKIQWCASWCWSSFILHSNYTGHCNMDLYCGMRDAKFIPGGSHNVLFLYFPIWHFSLAKLHCCMANLQCTELFFKENPLTVQVGKCWGNASQDEAKQEFTHYHHTNGIQHFLQKKEGNRISCAIVE